MTLSGKELASERLTAEKLAGGEFAEGERERSGGSTSRSLLAEARLEDPVAWTRLVTLYAPLVAAWSRRWGVAEQDLADLSQEVFTAVARGLENFRRDQAHHTFRGWLATIARNKVYDYFRSRRDEPRAAGGTEASIRLARAPDRHAETPDATDGLGTADSEFGELLRRALDSIRGEFQEKTWLAFWSVVVDGRSTSDVANELSMRPGTVRVCKSRVLARLRVELGDEPPRGAT